MRNVLIAFGAIVLLGAIGGATWSIYGRVRPASSGMATSTALQVTTPPPIAAPTATPNIITVGTSTAVIFTVSIPEPTLNPASVNLIRVAPNGSSTVVAQMVDNGQNGDQKPGDKMFTARVVFNEPQAGEVTFQVSAAFRGVLRRSLSPLIRVSVWSTTSLRNTVTFAYPGRLIPTHTSASSITGIAFSTQGDYMDGMPPLFKVSIVSLPNGVSLQTWIINSGGSVNTIQNLTLGGRVYFKWSEVIDYDEPINVVSFSTVLTDGRVLTFTTPSQSYSVNDEFLTILSSAQVF